ncbi:hypothetical protein MNBD_GAMMA25-867 [hydrothermal vent metagenome]|uniref:Uncharacterized protein n=1 Tax=hydrothermal vent metagenome TaxID=652676 RepID=A0A3B1AXT9_9ZZZZ
MMCWGGGVVFKSDWSGWLVLAALFAFPLMFFITRPQGVDFLEIFEYSDISNSQSEVNQLMQIQQSVSSDTANEREHQDELSQGLDSDLESDLTDNNGTSDYSPKSTEPEIHEQEEYDPDSQESFPPNESYDNTAAYRPVENNISAANFTRSNYGQGQSGAVFEETVSAQVVSSTTSAVVAENTVTEKNTVAEDNNNLYLAKMDYVVESVKKKCPPVYGKINSYARNMRIVMGCDTE